PAKAPSDFNFQPPHFSHKTFQETNTSLKQVYALIGFEGLPVVSPLRHRLAVLNDILGGGMSSRLVQVIREQKGLAYTVSSFNDNYLDCGLQLIYSIIDQNSIEEYLDAVKNEILRLKKDGITQDELDRSSDHIKAAVILSLESNVSRMRFHVNHEVNLKREITIKEIVNNISQSTVENINQLANDFLNLDKAAIFLYGDIGDTPYKVEF
ncbi:MAG: insulinase family protein, partial [bacterium]|nr:insulinase family protein [bacterium]